MATGDNAYLQNPAVIGVDWVGFLCLAFTSFYLFYKLTNFHGPEKDNAYYMGYREDKMLSIFVNLFAAMAYWARICSHANGDVGPAAQVVTYKYLDYILTCPLLTLDLLWSLNLPYKFTYAGFVFCCIVCAFMCSTLDGNARYMWFGMGICLFGFTWFKIIRIVRIRLDQFVSKEAKKVRTNLKIACMTYFGIWCGYPTLWLLHEVGVISDVVSAILHTVFDVIAKSLYGFALLSFVLKGEKSTLIFVPLVAKPGSKDDDYCDEEMSIEEEEPNRIGHNQSRRPSAGTLVGAKPRRSSTRNQSLNESETAPNAFWSKVMAHQAGASLPHMQAPPHDNPNFFPSPGQGMPPPVMFGFDGPPRYGGDDHGEQYQSSRRNPAPPMDNMPGALGADGDSSLSETLEVNRVQHQIRAVEQELANLRGQNEGPPRHMSRAI